MDPLGHEKFEDTDWEQRTRRGIAVPGWYPNVVSEQKLRLRAHPDRLSRYAAVAHLAHRPCS